MTGFKSCVGLFSRLHIALDSVEYPNYLFKPKQVYLDLPSQLLEIESLLKFKTSVNDFFQKM